MGKEASQAGAGKGRKRPRTPGLGATRRGSCHSAGQEAGGMRPSSSVHRRAASYAAFHYGRLGRGRLVGCAEGSAAPAWPLGLVCPCHDGDTWGLAGAPSPAAPARHPPHPASGPLLPLPLARPASRLPSAKSARPGQAAGGRRCQRWPASPFFRWGFFLLRFIAEYPSPFSSFSFLESSLFAAIFPPHSPRPVLRISIFCLAFCIFLALCYALRFSPPPARRSLIERPGY